jgi:hypothetical protein
MISIHFSNSEFTSAAHTACPILILQDWTCILELHNILKIIALVPATKHFCGYEILQYLSGKSGCFKKWSLFRWNKLYKEIHTLSVLEPILRLSNIQLHRQRCSIFCSKKALGYSWLCKFLHRRRCNSWS